MKMQDREITAEYTWVDGFYIAKILQVDAVNLNPGAANPVTYKYGLTAKFDEDLVLKEINIDYLQGSRQELCSSVGETLKQLVGAQVGRHLGGKVMGMSDGSFCMHFELLLLSAGIISISIQIISHSPYCW